jgi:site-specific recombinase XerD
VVRSILPQNAKPGEKVFAAVPRISTFRRDLERAGIPFEDAQGRRVDLHSLRVTLGSNLFASGGSLVVVKELMQHSDIKTTLRHYADASHLPLAAAVAH